MKKQYLLSGLMTASLLLAACNAATTPDDITIDVDGGTVDETTGMDDGDGASSADGAADDDSAASEDATDDTAATDEMRVIEISASNWEFSPNSIAAKKGEKVMLRIVGQEGMHGFAIPGLGINLSIPAGQTVEVELPTDKTGEFEFFCSIPCGSGHKGMRGKVVIS